MRGGLCGKSTPRIEYENLQQLHRLGIAPKPLNLYEIRQYFFLRKAFITIEEIPEADSLDVYIFTKLKYLSKKERKSFIESLAKVTRKMNRNGFINGEYHWRNVMVTRSKQKFQFYIIDPSKRRLRDQYFFYLYGSGHPRCLCR